MAILNQFLYGFLGLLPFFSFLGVISLLPCHTLHSCVRADFRGTVTYQRKHLRLVLEAFVFVDLFFVFRARPKYIKIIAL